MRCIEMKAVEWCQGYGLRLIETWDVLKCKKHPDIVLVDKINRNMRCIEILAEEGTHTDIEGLIETWDVLKLNDADVGEAMKSRLIETWDVLKWWLQ